MWFLNKYRHKSLFYEFSADRIPCACDGHYVKKAFFRSGGSSFPTPQIGLGGLHYPFLLGDVHAVLWRSLDILPAGLHLNKMYSICVS